jgi:hypothetical protein
MKNKNTPIAQRQGANSTTQAKTTLIAIQMSTARHFLPGPPKQQP